MTRQRDHRWQRVLENVPRDLLVDLAKKRPNHRIERLYKDSETLVDEVFRVCRSSTIQTLYEEFPGPEYFAVWFYVTEERLSKSMIEAAWKRKASTALLEGIVPANLAEEPQLHKVEELTRALVFRYAARDSKQNLAVSFGEKEPIWLVSNYSAILHYSDVRALICGSYAARKAKKVLDHLDSWLSLDRKWILLKPRPRQSRDFYNKIKRKLGAYLIRTERHDPAGNYKTVTLRARDRSPDLERVRHFQLHFLNADSYYDVLEYKCKNRLGLQETTWVKFGQPFGRFTFKAETSMSAMHYFGEKLSEVLH